jgi:ATP-dependent protease ClpP protease subunit
MEPVAKILTLDQQREKALEQGIIIIDRDFTPELYNYANIAFRILKLQQVPSVTLEISSAGGDAWVGKGLADEAMNYPGRVTAIIKGDTCSSAAILSQACHHRIMLANASLHFHYIYSIKTPAHFGSDYIRERHLDNLELNQATVTEFCLKRAKMSPQDWHKLLVEERSMYPDEALRLGFVDEIIKPAWLYNYQQPDSVKSTIILE